MVLYNEEYNNESARYIRSNHVALYDEEYTFMNNYFPQVLRISHRTTSGYTKGPFINPTVAEGVQC